MRKADKREHDVSQSPRIVDGTIPPTTATVAQWIGPRNFTRWTAITEFIENNYPGVFDIEWLYAGKKHGWGLRYKKSKSFCSFVPERGAFKLLMVFGAADREKVEGILPTLASHVREDYENASTFADGKWVLVNVDNARVLDDVKRLLVLKRRPKAASVSTV